MMSNRFAERKEAYLAVEYKGNELKREILNEMDRKMILLETRLMQ